MTRFLIVPEASRCWIDARSSLHPIHSETTGLQGWIEIAMRRGRKVDLTAATGGHLELAVKRLRAGNPLEERELKRRIDARRFPTIDGDLTTISGTGVGGRYTVEGDLTFRGVTRRHRDEMTIRFEGDHTLRMTGQSTFDVRDFGMEPPRIGMLRVEPEVTVRIEIVAEAEATD